MLKIKNLTKSFALAPGHFFQRNERKVVFENISLEITRGERMALIGPSGCGKTTIGKCLAGLEPPDSGKIIYNQTNILELKNSAARSIWSKFPMVFQDAFNSLNPKMSVGTAIEEVLKHTKHIPRKHVREEAMQLLSRVRLKPELHDRKPWQLSGGQQRRVVIARALAAGPEFLIADEPGSGLDTSVKNDIFELLDDLNKTLNLTLLIISHDIRMMNDFSARIFKMENKNIQVIN